jgi:succinate dehydrogenase hydrophobic anchor subunit
MRKSEERRRLSANWLNTIASGVITAGTCGSFLAFSLGANSAATAVRVIAIWAGAVMTGTFLHLAARALLPPEER